MVPSAEGDGHDPVPSISLIPPRGIPGSVAIGIKFQCDEFKSFFTSNDKTWRAGKLNIKNNCTSPFLIQNWEAWRKLAQPPYDPSRSEIRKSFLHYAGLELHGVKVDWRTVDLSIPMNTISSTVRMNARRELYRMKVKMDGELVEPLDPDLLERPRRAPKKVAATEKIEKSTVTPRIRKRARLTPPTAHDSILEDPVRADEANTPSEVDGVQTRASRKGKEKLEGMMPPLAPYYVQEMRDEIRALKEAIKESRRDAIEDPPANTPRGQTSAKGSNQMSAGGLQVPQPASSSQPASLVMEETASDVTRAMKRMQDEHMRVIHLRESLEEELVLARQTILNLEAEKKEMHARVATMGRKDLHEVLKAKLQGYHIKNHPSAIAYFDDINLTCTRKWTGIPNLDLEALERRPEDFPEHSHLLKDWVGWKEFCLFCQHPLGFLPSISTGVCQHRFHFNCFWECTSTRRSCPVCRKILPKETYEFFCTVFLPDIDETICPDTGIKINMESGTHPDELSPGRGGEVSRNEVDVAAANNERKLVFTEVNKALQLWVQDNFIPRMSFITGHRTLKSKIDREGVEASYVIICEGLKLAASGHQKPLTFYEHMKSIFDSYVNPEGDPSVSPLVTGLDAQNFDVEVFIGLEGDTERETGGALTPDYLDGLPRAEARRIRGSIDAMDMEPPRVTRAGARTRLQYIVTDPDSPPTSPLNPMELVEPISTITPVVEEPELPCASDLVVVRSTPPNVIDLSQTGLASLDDDMSTEYGWPKRSDLSKEDIESVQQKEAFVRGDVINWYINRRWLSKTREELAGIYFVNTFWFPSLIGLMSSIQSSATLAHNPFLRLRRGTTRQKSGYECGYHVMQLISDLAGKLDRLDLYFAQKGRSSDLALPMDVLTFELMLKMCLDPKEKRDLYPI
ncbi:hypothetical protein R1sor_016553 [Riccia sorocarpa]|uniref:RING-type domain-containing protein n=1 Tax=Riccia sorocarpa TaxID=122646 RepID=A0ABD3HLK2_9MARC